MSSGVYGMLAGVAALSVFTFAQPASALTMKECSAKYKAAQDAGAVGSMNWNDFRSAECGADATVALKKAKAAPSAAATGPSMQECSAKYQAAKEGGTLGGMTWNEFRSAGCPTTIAKRSGSMTPAMGSIFPTNIAKKYARERAGKTRMLTCRDQYRANKAAGITEPRWTEEGGGYYSECNKRLSQQ